MKIQRYNRYKRHLVLLKIISFIEYMSTIIISYSRILTLSNININIPRGGTPSRLRPAYLRRANLRSPRPSVRECVRGYGRPLRVLYMMLVYKHAAAVLLARCEVQQRAVISFLHVVRKMHDKHQGCTSTEGVRSSVT